MAARSSPSQQRFLTDFISSFFAYGLEGGFPNATSNDSLNVFAQADVAGLVDSDMSEEKQRLEVDFSYNSFDE